MIKTHTSAHLLSMPHAAQTVYQLHNYASIGKALEAYGSWLCVSSYSSIHLYKFSCIMELGAQTISSDLFLISQCKACFIPVCVLYQEYMYRFKESI